MKKLLSIILLSSGIFSIFALLFPTLILLGLIFFILPGLIIGFSPAVFLWTATFSIVWYPIQHFKGSLIATLLAFFATVAYFWFAPTDSMDETDKRFETVVNSELLPKNPIALSGNIRLSTTKLIRQNRTKVPEWRAKDRYLWACDSLCVALLLTDKVDSVSIAESMPFDKHEREGKSEYAVKQTFRLASKSQCPGSLFPALEYGSVETSDEFEKYVSLAINNDLCITTSETIQSGHEFRISLEKGMMYKRQNPHHFSTNAERWGFDAQPIEIERLKIENSISQILLQQSHVTTEKLRQPLLPIPDTTISTTKRNRGVIWNRAHLSNLQNGEKLEKQTILKTQTNMFSLDTKEHD